jgi:hypothetical protein
MKIFLMFLMFSFSSLCQDTIYNGVYFSIIDCNKVVEKIFKSSKYIKIIYEYNSDGILIRRYWYNKDGKLLGVILDN